GGRDSMAVDPVDNQRRRTSNNEAHDSPGNDILESEGEKEEAFDEANLSKISSLEFLEDEETFRERINQIKTRRNARVDELHEETVMHDNLDNGIYGLESMADCPNENEGKKE
ncbi:hypothetical protein PMAYCL1PPCAC_14001, partial [Pristionchus mayeri]